MYSSKYLPHLNERYLEIANEFYANNDTNYVHSDKNNPCETELRDDAGACSMVISEAEAEVHYDTKELTNNNHDISL